MCHDIVILLCGAEVANAHDSVLTWPVHVGWILFEINLLGH